MKKIRIRENPNFQGYIRIINQLARLKFSYGKDSTAPLAGSTIDPQVSRLLKVYSLVPRKTDLPARSAWRARQMLHTEAKLQKLLAPTKDRVTLVKDLHIPSPAGQMWVRAYHPSPGVELPVLVYYHGGGWVVGSPDTHDNLTRALASQVGCVVFSVDYRLAPEHPFPAAVEDAWAALEWAVQNASAYGGKPNRIAVGGDSAGGNLTAVVSQMARDRQGPPIACQLLLYPALDLSRLDRPSHLAHRQGFGLTLAEYAWYIQQYVPSLEERKNPLVSPLLAKNLSRLPPAFIVTAEYDILRDEGEEYADKLRRAGTPVNLRRENGMIHAYLSLQGVVDRADRAMREIAQELRLCLHGGG